MMKGGVSKTYVGWEAASAPYMSDKNRYYVKVINPKTGAEKEVRWYTDSHAIGIPSGLDKYEKDLYPLFGFTGDGEENWVWVISREYITDDEAEKYFGWKHGWSGCALFGPQYNENEEWWKSGCYYAPASVMEEELPPIEAGFDKYRKVNWPEWVKAAYNNTKSEGIYFDENNGWVNEYKRIFGKAA